VVSQGHRVCGCRHGSAMPLLSGTDLVGEAVSMVNGFGRTGFPLWIDFRHSSAF
jgi:hypothetical protein